MGKMRFLYLFMLLAVTSTAMPVKKSYNHYLQVPSIQRFRRYIQIDTSRTENLKYAVEFWRIQASEIGLPISVYEPSGLPICVITWEGADPALPSIMLNSHMDVVFADASEWKYPPYSGYMDENGDIYGRGTQDTKDVSIQYLEAIRKLKQDNIRLQRTLHVTLMPDEEVGGFKGIKSFIDTQEFKALNVGFALDEGFFAGDEKLYAIYEDRRPWQMEFTVHGASGHGYTLPHESAIEKARRLINVIMEYRKQLEYAMKNNPVDYGAYSSININMVTGGVAPNIIPSKYTIVADMRLSSESNVLEVEKMVNSWIAEAGNDTDISYIRREDVLWNTRLDESNPYWLAVQQGVTNMGLNIVPSVCPATTDMIVVRSRGIPAVGFTPKANITNRVHAKDEYTNVEIFLKGIDIYVEILKNLGNVSVQSKSTIVSNVNETCS